MKESEAKKRYCPFFGPAALIAAAAPNYAAIEKVKNSLVNSVYCVGSDCMAWRQLKYPPDSGYCGLAGKPE